MALTTARTVEIIKEYGQSPKDTGSSEVQIALLTERINHLTEHLRANKHDVHTRRGLTNLVSQRRRLMQYLKGYKPESYQKLIKALEIRG